jgi:DNA repair protein RecO (recombination protein O)
MSILKSEAIVLYSQRQGETSKRLQLYSKEYGKLGVIVKGSQSIKARHWGSLETLSYIEAVFYYISGRPLHYIKQASIIHAFPSLHSELGKWALAAIPLEIVNRTQEPEDSNSYLFDLLLKTLCTLEKNEKGLKNIIRAFELHMVSDAGFKPSLTRCDHCSNETEALYWHFLIKRGVLRCSQCGTLERESLKISTDARKALNWLMAVSILDSPTVLLPGKLGKEIDHILYAFLEAHLESMHNLKSVRALEAMQKNLQQNQNSR